MCEPLRPFDGHFVAFPSIHALYITDAHRVYRSDRRSGHFLARLGALTTHLRALLHLLIAVGHAVAIIGAGGTDLGALSAGLVVAVRPAAHESGRGPADVRTVLEKYLMIDRRMLSSKLETMSDGSMANASALVALSSTFLKVNIVQLMRHESTPFWKIRWCTSNHIGPKPQQS